MEILGLVLWLIAILGIIAYSWSFTGYGVYRAWCLARARKINDGLAVVGCAVVGTALLLGLVYPFSLVVILRWLFRRRPTKPMLQDAE